MGGESEGVMKIAILVVEWVFVTALIVSSIWPSRIAEKPKAPSAQDLMTERLSSMLGPGDYTCVFNGTNTDGRMFFDVTRHDSDEDRITIVGLTAHDDTVME